MLPSACAVPVANPPASSVAALPMSICPQAMSYGRPSSAVDLVSPVIACFVAVYATDRGRGVCAEIEPLLMIRPPRGRCSPHHPERLPGTQERAGQVHRDHRVPGRQVDARRGRPPARDSPGVVEQQVDPAVPARPWSSNSAAHAASSVTSVGTGSSRSCPAATASSASRRRPASTTVHPSAASARADGRADAAPAAGHDGDARLSAGHRSSLLAPGHPAAGRHRDLAPWANRG